MHDLDRTLRTYETESDYELVDESYEMTEESEIDLAAEMLSVSDEQELDQFLGKLIKKAGRFVRPLAKTLLPIAGKVAGGFFGGPAGAAIGGKLGSFASGLFEIDMESIAPEERDMEVARNFVRLATAAASNAAAAPPNADPRVVARNAVISAAKTYAPGLIRPRNGAGATGSIGSTASGSGASGQWFKRGNRIIVVGVK